MDQMDQKGKSFGQLIVDRLEEELGSDVTVVATGGLAKKIVPYCRRKIILDDNLLLKGLAIIYRKNRK